MKHFLAVDSKLGCCRKVGHPNWSGNNTDVDVDVNHNTDHVVLFDETLALADMDFAVVKITIFT